MYEGEYKDNQKNGFGKLVFADKSFYQGNFLNNQMHGFGV